MLSSVVAGQILVQSPGLNGEFWMDVRSHLFKRIATEGNYEPEVTAALERCAERDFIDIGANVGFFSIHLALRPTWQGRVFAIEPNPRAFDFLEQNIAHNDLQETITALKFAVAENASEIDLVAVDGREEYSTISNTVHPSVKDQKTTTYRVSAAPLDQLLEGKNCDPGLIKIDAEGAELFVLKGMATTIRKYQPTIVCEIGGGNFGADVLAVKEVLKSHDYRILNLNGQPVSLDAGSGGEIIAQPNRR